MDEMRITAIEDHKCSCCGNTIKKGTDCYIWFNYPEDRTKTEYEVLYECIECTEKQKCRGKA